jgi:hypothetical protein
MAAQTVHCIHLVAQQLDSVRDLDGGPAERLRGRSVRGFSGVMEWRFRMVDAVEKLPAIVHQRTFLLVTLHRLRQASPSAFQLSNMSAGIRVEFQLMII